MAGSFLQRSRHGTVFYFRRRVPDDLRAIVGHSYIVKSLTTEERRVAVIRARFLASQTDALFAKCRTMPNTDDDSTTLFTLSISVDEIFGRRTAVASDIQPGEEIAAAIGMAALQDHLDGKPPTPQLQSALEAQLRPPAPVAPAQPVGMPFRDALAYYLDNSDAKVSSRQVYRTRLMHAQQFFGEDSDARSIRQADLMRFKRYVAKDVGKGSQGHVIRQLVTMLGFVGRAHDWGGQLTTRDLVPKTKKTPASQDRNALTLEQLSVLFEYAKRYKDSGRDQGKYWATIALPFTGCRITELCQINLDTDLRHDKESGVWFFNIEETPDEDEILRQSLKNGQSWRKVPIHSALVKLGFIDYLHAQMKAGFTRPFEKTWQAYQLKPPAAKDAAVDQQTENDEVQHQWGRRASNWASLTMKELRKSGAIIDPDKKLGYFHSMRHTFSKTMVGAGIPFDIREAAIGHKYGGDDAERYAKIKESPALLSEMAYEPGLAKIAALLDNL